MNSRWHEETKRAAEHLGWHVVDSVGTDDYQGSGAHLLRGIGDRWAVLAWTFGSCSGCDMYEDVVGYKPTGAKLAEVFGDLIANYETEAEARAAFSDGKGW